MMARSHIIGSPAGHGLIDYDYQESNWLQFGFREFISFCPKVIGTTKGLKCGRKWSDLCFKAAIQSGNEEQRGRFWTDKVTGALLTWSHITGAMVVALEMKTGKFSLSLNREKGGLMLPSGFLHYQGTGEKQLWRKENQSRGQNSVGWVGLPLHCPFNSLFIFHIFQAWKFSWSMYCANKGKFQEVW